MISMTTETCPTYTLVSIELPEGVAEPSDLRDLQIPKVDCTKGVVLSGRAPVWVFGALVHHFHPTAWVATYDPRLGGAIVVATHRPGVSTGDIIPLS